MPDDSPNVNRRRFVGDGLRAVGAAGLLGAAGAWAGRRGQATDMRWQIDPDKCVACGQCATHCVLDKSAVVCKHAFVMCGYCDLCTGYFEPQPLALDSGAENQLCPTGAIVRRFVEDPYFEYTIDEQLCIGCGKCVKGCNAFGNGSLYLQVDHARCVNCNECAIARDCPSEAFCRVRADEPYLRKDRNLGQ
ncbi:MAG: 4Fe-4S binding protein [Pirellulales bacterium]|nr:4Fe-4S binding protein [Pirellulales bacterium]